MAMVSQLCVMTAATLMFSVQQAQISPQSATRPAALGERLRDLGSDRQRELETGRELFQKIWTPAEGLGPRVNAQSCLACHGEPVAGGYAAASTNFVLLS